MTAVLKGKVAIVTGGAWGIGKSIAQKLCHAGATTIIGDINDEAARLVADALLAVGYHCEARHLNMGNHGEITSFVAQIIGHLGGIDIVVNNAVRTDPADGRVADLDEDLWTILLATNVIGPAVLSRGAIPSMIARGGGAFVHIASAAGVQAEDTRTCYGAAKAALISLSRQIAVQYGKQGIRSNSISPGLILSPAASASFDQPLLDLLKEHHMTQDVGTPEDIAEAAMYLLSPAARFVTGHNLLVDGGFTAVTPVVPAFRRAGL